MSLFWELRIFLCVAVLIALSVVALAESNEDLSQRYLAVYLGINDAEQLEKNKDFAGALKGFQDCSDKLQAIHVSNPDWHAALVMHRLNDFRAKILDLQDKMAEAGKTTPAKGALDQSSEAFPRPIKTSKTSYSWKKGHSHRCILDRQGWCNEKCLG